MSVLKTHRVRKYKELISVQQHNLKNHKSHMKAHKRIMCHN
jgi:hypothetical protein